MHVLFILKILSMQLSSQKVHENSFQLAEKTINCPELQKEKIFWQVYIGDPDGQTCQWNYQTHTDIAYFYRYSTSRVKIRKTTNKINYWKFILQIWNKTRMTNKCFFTLDSVFDD